MRAMVWNDVMQKQRNGGRVRKLIQINQAANNGATPLYIACQNDRVKVVNALLSRKEIQLNQVANDGTTPEKRFKSIILCSMEQHHCA